MLTLISFIKGQMSAAIFGIALLSVMLLSKVYYPSELSQILSRYDFIFIFAISFQAFLILFGYETWREAKVILVFHILATLMEVFKTSHAIGSWSYPEECYFKIAQIPLFAGFMYSAVGSYIARSWRLMKLSYESFPSLQLSLCLAGLIYLNFFTHHYIYDLRYILLISMVFIYRRSFIQVQIAEHLIRIHFLLALGFASLAIYLAENIGTYAKVWIYPQQAREWQWVSPNKLLAWFLLMLLSFALIQLSYQQKTKQRKTQEALA